MIIRTPQTKVDEYYQRTSLNQSSLKVIMNAGMQKYLEIQTSLIAQEESDLYYEEKEHFLIGSAVDCYITMGEECYNNSYHFSNVPKPGDSVMAIIKHVYDSTKDSIGSYIELKDLKRQIHNACDINSFYMNRKKTFEEEEKLFEEGKGRIFTVLKDPNAKGYFESLLEAKGRQVLSDNQNLIINSIINNFTSHPYTDWVFKDGKDIDIIYQLPIYFTVDGIFCKALIDLTRVHHGTKTITGVDIKTTGDFVTEFNKNIRKRGYHVQASFYTEALKQSKEIISKMLGKDVRDYNVGKFAFVVESTKAPICPSIFILKDELLNKARYGYQLNQMDWILGWQNGIEIYKAWSDKGLQLEEVLGPHKGVVHIDEYFQYINFN